MKKSELGKLIIAQHRRLAEVAERAALMKKSTDALIGVRVREALTASYSEAIESGLMELEQRCAATTAKQAVTLRHEFARLVAGMTAAYDLAVRKASEGLAIETGDLRRQLAETSAAIKTTDAKIDATKEAETRIQNQLATVTNEMRGQFSIIELVSKTQETARAALQAEIERVKDFASGKIKQFAEDFAISGQGSAIESAFLSAFKGTLTSETIFKRGELWAYRGGTYIAYTGGRGQLPTRENQKGPKPIWGLIAAPGAPGISYNTASGGGGGAGVSSVAGTANKVLVNGGTTPAAGDVVLSLPSSITVNASTATALQTARTINGVAFDGTADISISAAAAADQLTGTTLATNVVTSSLTSVGTLTSGAIGAGFTAIANARLANSTITIGGTSTALGGTVLGNVTNDTQTKAAIVPNTAPSAGQVLAGNAGGTAYAPVSVSGDGTLSSAGALAVTKTGGVAFAASATTDTTNAANISSGTLLAARMPALTGDVTTSAGAVATTLATVNSNVGTFGSATKASVVTVNAKGLVTAASESTVTPAVGSITGLGTGVATFLATPSSANLAAALTDETGSGAAVFATSPSLVTPVLGTPTSGNLSNCTADGTSSVGFRNIPQNSQSAAYTTVLTDAAKHIYHPSADTTARTWTIDSNANVAYVIGTAITFVNDSSAGVITIAITSDTLVLAGTGSTGSRTLAANGVATAIKVTSTRWQINGTGLT